MRHDLSIILISNTFYLRVGTLSVPLSHGVDRALPMLASSELSFDHLKYLNAYEVWNGRIRENAHTKKPPNPYYTKYDANFLGA